MLGCDHKAIIVDKKVESITSTKFEHVCKLNRYNNNKIDYIVIKIDMDNYTRYQHGVQLYYEKEKGFYND